jgi:hypothetical protein
MAGHQAGLKRVYRCIANADIIVTVAVNQFKLILVILFRLIVNKQKHFIEPKPEPSLTPSLLM